MSTPFQHTLSLVFGSSCQDEGEESVKLSLTLLDEPLLLSLLLGDLPAPWHEKKISQRLRRYCINQITSHSNFNEARKLFGTMYNVVSSICGRLLSLQNFVFFVRDKRKQQEIVDCRPEIQYQIYMSITWHPQWHPPNFQNLPASIFTLPNHLQQVDSHH